LIALRRPSVLAILAALVRKAGVLQDSEPPEVELALSAERERDFEEWVGRRLSDWSIAEIRAFDRWLLAESLFEFIPAVRATLRRRGAEAAARRGSGRESVLREERAS
jgi:hypothetical protein